MALSKNKSDIYGGYGGVSQQNHYVPVCSTFEPQPATVPLNKTEIRTLLERLTAEEIQFSNTFLSSNSANIVFRNMLIDKGGYKTFVMFTQADPSDTLTFTTRTTSISPIIPTQEIAPETIETENIILTESALLTANKNYFITTSVSPITATLPFFPALGDFININFTKKNFNLIINGNGSIINGIGTALTVGKAEIFGLVYNSVNASWDYIPDSSSNENMLLLDGGTF